MARDFAGPPGGEAADAPGTPLAPSSSVARLPAFFVCAAAAAAATVLPWFRFGLGSDVHTYRGTDLWILTAPVLALIGVSAVAAGVGVIRRQAHPWRIAGGVAGLLAIGLALLALVSECLATFIPSGLIPVSARRLSVAVAAGSGLWLALAAMTVASLLARSVGSPRLARLASRPFASPITAGGCAALTLLSALVGWVRYRPWAHATAGGHGVTLQAWVMPWVGPASLVALWLMAAALLSVAVSRTVLGALLAAGGGWLLSFSAAAVIVSGQAAERLGLRHVAPAALKSYSPSFGVGSAVWVAFAAGLLAAAVGAGLLAALSPTRAAA